MFFDKKKKLFDFFVLSKKSGIYVPMLAEALRKDQSTHFNLRGIGVGDGCQVGFVFRQLSNIFKINFFKKGH